MFIKFVSIFFLLHAVTILYAQNSRISGTITGLVLDKDTGQPVEGANVYLDGYSFGASTDEDGYFVLLNVPASEYTLVISFIGYKTFKYQNIEVRPGGTHRFNISLEPELVEGETITVTAQKPLVETNVTSTIKNVSSQEIKHSPTSDFNEIIAKQLGAIETGRGRRSGGIHIRGGRSNETVYYVDGVNVTDPFVGNVGVAIDNNSIDQLQIITGGFDAEYGESMSGVVQIVTKSGDLNKYNSQFEVISDAAFASSKYDWGYDKYYANFSGPIPGLKNKNATFFWDGSLLNRNDRVASVIKQDFNDSKGFSSRLKINFELIPSVLRFQVVGDFEQAKEHIYSHPRSAYPFWLHQGIQQKTHASMISLSMTHTISSKSWYDINLMHFENTNHFSSQDGANYNEFKAINSFLPWVGTAENLGLYNRQTGEFNGISEEDAFYYYYATVANEGKGFVHLDEKSGEWIWNSPEAKKEAYNSRYYDTGYWSIENGEVVYNEFLLDNYSRFLKDKKNPDNEKYDYNGDIDDFFGREKDILGNYSLDFVPWWHRHTNSFIQGEFIFSSQINKENLLKLGGWLKQYDLEYSDIQFLNTKPYFDAYKIHPFEAAAFIQNNFKFDDLSINTGLRFDYADPAAKHLIDIENLDLGKTDTKAEYQFSPRAGISFAATSDMYIYIHYGQFFQKHEFSAVYQNLNADVTNGLPIIGDPSLPHKKTTAYEIGFQNQLTEYIALKIYGFYKDGVNLLSTDNVNALINGRPQNYTTYRVNDFAKIKGFGLNLKKRIGPGLSGEFSYSLLDAKGTGSSATDFYYDYLGTGVALPRKEYRLDFDVTYDIKATINYNVPQGNGPEFFGFKLLSDSYLSIDLSWNSGAVYTPFDKNGPLEVGSGNMPANHEVDLRFDKYVSLGISDVELDFFIDIRNLFNTRNVVEVYPLTGKPDDPGGASRPIWDPVNTFQYSGYKSYGYNSEYDMFLADLAGWKKRMNDPSHYSNPRIIRTGLGISF